MSPQGTIPLGTVFGYNGIIKTFRELNYFRNVTTINSSAFRSDTELTELGFDNIKAISQYGAYLTAIESWVFEEGLTSLSNIAITTTYKAKYIDLPSTVQSIGNSNFINTSQGCVVVCRATSVPTLGSRNTEAGVAAFYVPAASVSAYKAAQNWSAAAGKICAIEGTWYETHRSLEP